MPNTPHEHRNRAQQESYYTTVCMKVPLTIDSSIVVFSELLPWNMLVIVSVIVVPQPVSVIVDMPVEWEELEK